MSRLRQSTIHPHTKHIEIYAHVIPYRMRMDTRRTLDKTSRKRIHETVWNVAQIYKIIFMKSKELKHWAIDNMSALLWYYKKHKRLKLIQMWQSRDCSDIARIEWISPQAVSAFMRRIQSNAYVTIPLIRRALKEENIKAIREFLPKEDWKAFKSRKITTEELIFNYK